MNIYYILFYENVRRTFKKVNTILYIHMYMLILYNVDMKLN